MPIATGVNKRLYYKAESTWNTAAGASGAQALRRVSSELNLKKDTFESNELATHLQRLDYRHGLGHVEGSISGELSPGTWKDFFAAATRKAYTAVTAISGASITIAGSGPTYTVTRAAGSFLTDGVKAGDVVRLSVGSFNAANINKNLLVVSMTATVLTVMPLNGVALVAEGPIATSTVTVTGKKTYVPMTSHTDISFSIEQYYSDLTLSELYTGCKINQLDVAMPPAGMATIGLQMIGGGRTNAGVGYFSSPTAETTTGLLAAPNGILTVAGSKIATLTGLSFSIKGNMSGEAVIGSSTFADITEGRIIVEGQFTALFDSATVRDYFDNETEVALAGAITTSPSASADFIGFSFPRIKVGGADKSDGEKSIVQTLPFVALLNSAGGAGTSSEQSSAVFQDSQA